MKFLRFPAQLFQGTSSSSLSLFLSHLSIYVNVLHPHSCWIHPFDLDSHPSLHFRRLIFFHATNGLFLVSGHRQRSSRRISRASGACDRNLIGKVHRARKIGRSEKEERVASWLFVPGRVFKGGRSGPGPLISSSILSNGSKLVTHCRLRFKWPEAIEEKTFQRLTVGVPLITATISRPRFLESFRSFPRIRNFYHFSLSMIFPSNFCISTPTLTPLSRIRNSIDANFLIVFSIVFSEFYKFRPSIRDLYQVSDFSRVSAFLLVSFRGFEILIAFPTIISIHSTISLKSTKFFDRFLDQNLTQPSFEINYFLENFPNDRVPVKTGWKRVVAVLAGLSSCFPIHRTSRRIN